VPAVTACPKTLFAIRPESAWFSDADFQKIGVARGQAESLAPGPSFVTGKAAIPE